MCCCGEWSAKPWIIKNWGVESKQTLRGLFCKNVSVTLSGIYVLLTTCLVFCCQYVFDDHSSIITGSLYILRKGLESFVGDILWKKFVNLSKKNLKSFLVSSSVQTFSRIATQWCDVVVIILPWAVVLESTSIQIHSPPRPLSSLPGLPLLYYFVLQLLMIYFHHHYYLTANQYPLHLLFWYLFWRNYATGNSLQCVCSRKGVKITFHLTLLTTRESVFKLELV